MENKINEINRLYIPALAEIEQLKNFLYKRQVDYAFGFRYQHHIWIKGNLIEEQYPIPVMYCSLQGKSIEFGIDIVQNEEYIGYLKLHLSRKELITFDFKSFKDFNFEIYRTNYQKINNIKEIKHLEDSNFLIYSKFKSIEQIYKLIVDSTVTKHRIHKGAIFYCDCKHEVTMHTKHGKCPVCGKESPYKRTIKIKCDVCRKKYLTSKYDYKPCPNCGWVNDIMCRKFPKNAISLFMISLKKARQLYKINEPFRPNFYDFLEAFDFYGETGFKYNNIGFALYRHGENGIEMNWGPEPNGTIYFKNKEDFIENAKIGDEYIKDIWDRIEEPSYL